MPNSLSYATSPYLRQHQNNPVGWVERHMKNSLGVFSMLLTLFVNSHAESHGDCHRNYLLSLAQSPLLIKGRLLETKGFGMKVEVVKNVWGEPQSGDMDIAVFPNEEHSVEGSYASDRAHNVLKELDFDAADDADRYIFAFATKINDTLFMTVNNECGIFESKGGSVVLDRFFNVGFKSVREADFLEGMRRLHDDETSRTKSRSVFSDTLMRIKEDFYKVENKDEHIWWFFLAAFCVTAVQMMMFLGP